MNNSGFETMNQVLLDDLNSIVSRFDYWDDLRRSTILVTGGTGFIGSLLIKSLLRANDLKKTGISIVAQIRSEKKAISVFESLANRDDIRFIQENLEECNVQCDYIVHTACPTTSKFFVNNPVETLDIAIRGTRSMLELAKKNRVKKFVYLSSMEQYGIPYAGDTVMTENKIGVIDHLNVRSSYSEGKRVCELYCRSYFEEYGVNTVIARLAQTFGAGVNTEDNRVFMQFAKSVISNKDIVLHTKGESFSNFCYSSDAVLGLLLLLTKGLAGEAYNICNEKETRSISEIAHMVADSIASERIKVIYDIPDSGNMYGYAPSVQMILDSNKMMQIGWNVNVSLLDAYKRLIHYLMEI